jgi:hypothetical protein
MFVETRPETKGRAVRWLDELGRHHPRGFTLLLVLLAVGVALGLLLHLSPPIVLYQGF